MAKLDLTLNEFHIPGIGNYTVPFGTKHDNGVPLSTTQCQNNINMPFMLQRPTPIIETSTTTRVDADRRLIFQASGITLTMGAPASAGLRVEIATGFTEGSANVVFSTGTETTQTVTLAPNNSVVLVATTELCWRVIMTEKESVVVNTMASKMTADRRFLYPTTLDIVRFNGDTDFIVHHDLEHLKNKVYIRPGTSIPIGVENVGLLIWYSNQKVEIGVEAHDDTFMAFEPGKDYFLYLVYSPQLFPGNVNNLGFKLSLNDPEGISIYGNSDIAGTGLHAIKAYPEVEGITITDGNAICIGGFHTECHDDDELGGVMEHPFAGFLAGEINPYSVWDLYNRPKGFVAGYTLVPPIDLWASIYLLCDRGICKTSDWSNYGGKYPVNDQILVSVFNKPFATGATAKKFHGAKGEQILAFQRQRFPNDQEFLALSLGSPQGVNIQGSSNPTKSGGHYATDGKRIKSYCGCEDTVGVLYQWGQEYGGASVDSDADNFDSNDSDVKGKRYSQPHRVLFGGTWSNGSNCGSRSRYWSSGVLYLYSSLGFRGVSEPLHS